MLNRPLHQQVMFEILRDIYLSEIGTYLGFKGGTMLYFFERLDRFSVDLDFDLLLTKKINCVQKILNQILQKYGQIVEEREKRQTLLFLLSYQKNNHSLKVEVSKRTDNITEYEWRNFYGIDVQTMKLQDALAHKLVAATERKRVANRDFYDVWFLLKRGIRANEAIIKERTGKELKDYLIFFIEFVKKDLKSTKIMVGLGELLERSRRDWVKVKLKHELLSWLEFYLDEIVRY